MHDKEVCHEAKTGHDVGLGSECHAVGLSRLCPGTALAPGAGGKPKTLDFVKQVRLDVPHHGLTVSRIEQPGRGDQTA